MYYTEGEGSAVSVVLFYSAFEKGVWNGSEVASVNILYV